MLIKVNGKPVEIADGLSIKDLVESKKLAGSSVAVAVNDSVIHMEQWGITKLKPEDSVDIIRHVGGGQE